MLRGFNVRDLSIDILKVSAAICVVLIHLEFLKEISPVTNHFLANGLFRLSVPLFLIITGYFFTRIDSKSDFIKWFSRMIILYVIWSILYLPFWINDATLTSSLINLLNGFYALWYIAGVIIAGCFLYLIRNRNKSHLMILAFSLYLIGTLLQYLGNFDIYSGIVGKILIFTPTHRNFLFDCLPFLIIGLVISKIGITNIPKPKALVILISFALLFVESFINMNAFGFEKQLDMMFSLFILSPVIFICVMNLGIKGKYKTLSHYATAIYLIHPAVIFIGRDYIYQDNHSEIRYLFVIGALIPLSYLLVKLNSKIKVLL